MPPVGDGAHTVEIIQRVACRQKGGLFNGAVDRNRTRGQIVQVRDHGRCPAGLPLFCAQQVRVAGHDAKIAAHFRLRDGEGGGFGACNGRPVRGTIHRLLPLMVQRTHAIEILQRRGGGQNRVLLRRPLDRDRTGG